MDGRKATLLARLLSGQICEGERERILEEISTDAEAVETLLLAKIRGYEADLEPDLPFTFGASLYVGVHDRFLRVVDRSPNLTLAGTTKRVASALNRIGRGNLPACMKGRMEAEITGVDGTLPLLLTLDQVEESYRIKLAPSEPQGAVQETSGEAIEVWVDGVQVRTSPLSSFMKRPLSELKGGNHVVLRAEHSPQGIDVRLIPMEFGRNDWLAACLASGLVGDIPESLRVLRTLLPDFVDDSRFLRFVSSKLEALDALTKSVSCTLVPIPATRQTATIQQDRTQAFLPVWEGILTHWPDAAGLPNPWETRALENGQGTLPEHVLRLAKAVIVAAEGKADQDHLPAESSDSNLKAGWAALHGWRYLLERRYEDAFKAFASVEGKQDSFGLSFGQALAEHLSKVDATGEGEDERMESSEHVWSLVFDR